MTPGARVAAAIEILDRVLGEEEAEAALTRWARASRFAGSKDRAAVRDHVFDALRQRRSAAARGGAMTGRAMMAGVLAGQGAALDALFSGAGHAPPALSEAERAALAAEPNHDPATAADLPDPLWARLVADHGAAATSIAEALRHRAPVFLRVNLARSARDDAAARLAEAGIATRPHPEVATALEVTENPRRVQTSPAYLDGLVELQDAASQAAVLALPALDGARVLDYCAGGGGKALAMAALGARVTAHDAAPQRMRDLAARAARAGAVIPTITDARTLDDQSCDLVLCDVPCSGSGAWRRSPQAKWRLTEARLAELQTLQGQILRHAARFVAPQGRLAYATCSVFRDENQAQVAGFAAEGGWRVESERQWLPDHRGDGFFLAILARAEV